MFAYTGLNEEQILTMRANDGIYMTLDGRISVAGLNTGNLDYIAKSFHRVTKENGLGMGLSGFEIDEMTQMADNLYPHQD